VLWAHGIVGSSPAIPTPLGGVMVARCSDKAKAVVQLHPERFNKEQVMEQELGNKRNHFLIRGRGVTAAQQTFNLPGGGSNPHARAVAQPLCLWMLKEQTDIV
jgi:hypothetical protein